MMKIFLMLIFLTGIAVGHLGHPTLDVETQVTGAGNVTINSCNPYIGIIPGMENMTSEEVVFVLGPAYGFNITRDGLLTFENGSQVQIICDGD